MMNYIIALIVVISFSLIYLIIYCLNSKVKVNCEFEDTCNNCKIDSCFNKKNKEE